MSDPDASAEGALRWLRYATEDLDVAGALLATSPLPSRHVCWLSQQSAEKELKAALVLEGIEFLFTHDLDALRNRLPEGWNLRTTHSDLAELTQWAVETRYPGDWLEVTEEDALRAEAEARAIPISPADDFRHRGFAVPQADGD